MHKPAHIADNELIAQCKTGSLKYQEILYKRYYGFAMGISLRYSITREDALEVVNDAFIKVLKNIGSYNDDKPFKAWLTTLVINTAIDRRRKELKYLQHQLLDDSLPVLQHTIEAFENLNALDILKILAQLPTLHTTIFNLYEIDGYTHDEIANMLGIPASSSRVYLTRAKERLKKLLQIETYHERRAAK